MFRNALSRRVCEVVGVACFALALMWLVALASYSASDPVMFFSAPAAAPPANFAGKVGAFLSELSFQVLGYAAYLIPPMLVVVGWHYFWVRALKAPITKLIGALLLFASVSGLLSIAFERLDIGGKRFPAGGVIGKMVADMSVAQLNRTGSLIILLTIVFLAAIMATQLSLGAMAAGLGSRLQQLVSERLASFKQWREEKRREKQRSDVIRKHLEKGTQPEVVAKAVRTRQAQAAKAEAAAAAGAGSAAPQGAVAAPDAREARASRRAKATPADPLASGAGAPGAAGGNTPGGMAMDDDVPAPEPARRAKPQVRIKAP